VNGIETKTRKKKNGVLFEDRCKGKIWEGEQSFEKNVNGCQGEGPKGGDPSSGGKE